MAEKKFLFENRIKDFKLLYKQNALTILLLNKYVLMSYILFMADFSILKNNKILCILKKMGFFFNLYLTHIELNNS